MGLDRIQKIILLMGCICFISACSSNSKKIVPKIIESSVPNLEPVKIGAGPFIDQKMLTLKPLTSAGESFQAHFSSDSKKIIYHAQKRPEHTQSQIYELNLVSMREHRVTFHDGDDADAIYTSDNNYILYASTTDEIKEESEAISTVMKTYAPQLAQKINRSTRDHLKPYEIYLSKTDGSQISRITKSSGYDAELSINSKGNKILFVSTREGSPSLYLMPFQVTDWFRKISARPVTHTVKPIQLETNKHVVSSPSFLFPTDQTLWVQYSTDLKNSQIFSGDAQARHPRILTSKPALYFNPTVNFVTKELLFTSNRGDGIHMNLYTLDSAGLCLKRLTDNPDDETSPVFSPDGKQILFTSNLSRKNQIYLMDYISPHACLDEIP